MSDEPKSNWTKLVEKPHRFFLWLSFASLVGVALCMVADQIPGTPAPQGVRSAAAFVFAGLVVGFIAGFFGLLLSLIPPLRPLFRWIVRRSVFLFACLVTLVALFYAEENWRGKRAWEDVKQEAAAKGEHFDLESVVPPPVPDEENVAAAPVFKELCNELDPEWRRLHCGPTGITNDKNPLKITVVLEHQREPKDASADWMFGRRTDLKAWQGYYRNPESETGEPVRNEFPVARQPQTPAGDVLLALSKYDAVLVELRAASVRPKARFPLHYEDGFNVLLPHLSRIKGISRFLALRAAAEVAAGQTNAAASDVALSLRLVDLLQEEPLLISQLVRVAQLQVALGPLWEGMADHRWTDAQLAGFEQQLGQFDFLADFQRAMRGECVCCELWAVDYVRRERSFFDTLGLGNQSAPDGGSLDWTLKAVLFQLIPSGWFYQNEANIGRMHLELTLPLVDLKEKQVSPSNVNRLSAKLEQQAAHRSPYNWFAGLLVPAVDHASAKFAIGQTSANLARVACALERYRLAHGQYPEALNAVVPEFIPKLPHDVINGQPLIYRRTDDGSFVLYSVGWNETDDGGVVGLTKSKNHDWNKGDWVWRLTSE